MKHYESSFWHLGVRVFLLIFFFFGEITAQKNIASKIEIVKEDNFSPPLTLQKYLIEKTIDENEECTIGVAAGSATTDGRPLVWKTRDNSSAPNNKVYYNTNYPNKFISVITDGSTYAWMGVNEFGFAILNSNSTDLDDGSTTGLGNGSFMRYALGTCVTTTDLENLLDSTNITGRQTHANFGVIDSLCAAVIYETSGQQYWKFDANDTTQALSGYILRTNFAINGGGTGGLERYNRTVDLIADFYSGDTLNHFSILHHQMRDFSDYQSNPLPIPYPGYWSPGIPYGYIDCYDSICRSISVSAAVIQGILSGESAKLSTMWTMLGQPASSITVPYWPVGQTPAVSNGSSTAPLCDIANQIKSVLFDYNPDSKFINTFMLDDGYGNGLWNNTFLSEDSIFISAESKLNAWRSSFPNNSEILNYETDLANYTYSKLNQSYNSIIAAVQQNEYKNFLGEYSLKQNYPNPFNSTTTFEFTIDKSSWIALTIYNLLGEKITTLVYGKYSSGKHKVKWDISKNNEMGSGIYFYTLVTKSLESGNIVNKKTKRLLLLK